MCTPADICTNALQQLHLVQYCAPPSIFVALLIIIAPITGSLADDHGYAADQASGLCQMHVLA